MKRIATAAVAATLSLSALSAPAFAADADTAPAKENQGSSAQTEGDQAGEKVGSSEVYKKCKDEKKAENPAPPAAANSTAAANPTSTTTTTNPAPANKPAGH